MIILYYYPILYWFFFRFTIIGIKYVTNIRETFKYLASLSVGLHAFYRKLYAFYRRLCNNNNVIICHTAENGFLILLSFCTLLYIEFIVCVLINQSGNKLSLAEAYSKVSHRLIIPCTMYY